MNVSFYRSHGQALIVVEFDLVACLGLDGVLDEVRAYADSADLRALAAGLTSAYTGPVHLRPVEVLCWLRALLAVRAHLAATLALRGLPRDEVDALAALLAVDSPVCTAARAFLWSGLLLEELTAVSTATP
jgi:hypothetical protein